MLRSMSHGAINIERDCGVVYPTSEQELQPFYLRTYNDSLSEAVAHSVKNCSHRISIISGDLVHYLGANNMNSSDILFIVPMMSFRDRFPFKGMETQLRNLSDILIITVLQLTVFVRCLLSLFYSSISISGKLYYYTFCQ